MRCYGVLDESGHEAQPGYFGVAGFAGSRFQWEILRTAWARALQDVGAPYLHMREFAHSVGVFATWKGDKERRDALIAGVVGAVLDSKLTAFGSAMRVEDFTSLDERQRAHIGSPYHACLQDVLFGFQLTTESGPADWTCRVLADRTDENRAAAKTVYRRIRTERFPRFEKRLWFGDFREDVGLQAADLLAYEIVKELSNQDTRAADRMRWPLKRIIDDQRSRGMEYLKFNTREVLVAQAGLWLDIGEETVMRELGRMSRIYRHGRA